MRRLLIIQITFLLTILYTRMGAYLFKDVTPQEISRLGVTLPFWWILYVTLVGIIVLMFDHLEGFWALLFSSLAFIIMAPILTIDQELPLFHDFSSVMIVIFAIACVLMFLFHIGLFLFSEIYGIKTVGILLIDVVSLGLMQWFGPWGWIPLIVGIGIMTSLMWACGKYEPVFGGSGWFSFTRPSKKHDSESSFSVSASNEPEAPPEHWNAKGY